MISPLRIALIAALATAGLASAGLVQAKPRQKSIPDGPAQIAPAAGQVVDHDGLAWRLTVPEAWSWRPAKQRDEPVLLIYSPGVSDETALGSISELRDVALCTVTSKAEPKTAGQTQDEVNAAVRARYEKTKDSIKGADETNPLTALWTAGAVVDKKGIAMMTGFQPIAADEKMAALAGGANFSTPGFDHRVLCIVTLDLTKPDVINTPALTGVQALIASFEPL